MVHINELPENILLELFIHIPAPQLLRNCRLVCRLWRDLIDVVSLWKRKSLQEPVEDWKVFYILCSLQRNLLRNPCAEENLSSWRIDSNGGDRWKVETLPGSCGTSFPDNKVKKYFVTSFEVAPRADCGCTYQLRVQLASADYIVLASFEPPPVTFQQWNDAKWQEISHTFSDYPPGVRHILFQHGGQDTQFWKGWYGPRVTNSSIIISHRTAKNPPPARTLPEETVVIGRRRRASDSNTHEGFFWQGLWQRLRR